MNKQACWLTTLVLWLLTMVAHASTVTYVYTDLQGTPLMETDAHGNITARFEYTPYGVVVTSVGAAPDGPGYTGHVNDPETGLVYMQARYYDPMGHMLSIDPVGPAPGDIYSFNRYAYANNNPIVNMDPDGRQSTDDICMGNMQCESNEGGGGDPYAGHFYVQDQEAGAIQEGETQDQQAIAAAAPYVYGAASMIPGLSLVQCVAEGCSGTDWALATIAVIPVEGEAATAAKALEKTADLAKGAAAAERGLWKITQEGTERVVRSDRFGKIYKSESDGLWWARDTAGHGGSEWKVFRESSKGLEWYRDADKYGDFIVGKHKGDVGKFIPWKELAGSAF